MPDRRVRYCPQPLRARVQVLAHTGHCGRGILGLDRINEPAVPLIGEAVKAALALLLEQVLVKTSPS